MAGQGRSMSASSEYTVVPDIPDELLEAYLSQQVIAVDTELQGLRLGRDEVSLVQLCDRENRVCLVRPEPPKAPRKLKQLLSEPSVTKVFHFALTDVAFLRQSLGIVVEPYRCTKVMSKLVRTYTDSHSLKSLVAEFIGIELEKNSQSTNWTQRDLSPAQLQYAANDVLYLLPVYDALNEMLAERGKLPSGLTAAGLNERCQDALRTMVELVLSGYGNYDGGWEPDTFKH